MPSIKKTMSAKASFRFLFVILALVLLGLVAFLVFWPTIRPISLDLVELYQRGEQYAQQRRWEALEDILTKIGALDENTRQDGSAWVRWLNLARRLGLATQRWEPLRSLSQKALSELPGNPQIRAFHLYVMIKSRYFVGSPLQEDQNIPAFRVLYRRYLLDYYIFDYYRRTGLQGLFNPSELLRSTELSFWSHMADALPNEPLFISRALLAAIKENQPDLFLKYLGILELQPKSQQSLFLNWNPSVINRLIGLANFRLGRWESAATFLSQISEPQYLDRTAIFASAESNYRLGRLKATEIILRRQFNAERENSTILDSTVYKNLVFLYLNFGDVPSALRVLPAYDSFQDIKLYLQIIQAPTPASKQNLQKQFIRLLSEKSGQSLASLFYYYASFPELLTPVLLNTVLNRGQELSEEEEIYFQSIVEMLLWQLNKQGKFDLAIETGEGWLKRWPNAWFITKEMALALAQMPNRAQAAYDLWTTAPVVERNLFWEYVASRLAAQLVRAQGGRRDYTKALEHNYRAEQLIHLLPSSRASQQFLARVLFDRAIWLYFMGNNVDSQKSLRLARSLDPQFISAQNYLNTSIFQESANEN
jgi:hypothetical protein